MLRYETQQALYGVCISAIPMAHGATLARPSAAARLSAVLSSRHRAVLAAEYVRGRPRSWAVKASGATLIEGTTGRLNRAALAARKGGPCKRCDACGNSPDSDTGSNSSLNSGLAATSSEYRYRVPKSAIERSQSWRKQGPPQVDGPAVAGQAQEMRKQGACPDIDLAAAGALRERMKESNDHDSHPDYHPNLDHLE